VLPHTELELVVADSLGTMAGQIHAASILARSGVVAIIAGTEGGLNQNLTLLPEATALLGMTPRAYTRSISERRLEGVGYGSPLLRMMSMAAMAFPNAPPIVSTSHIGCASTELSDLSAHPLLVHMCTSMRSIADAMSTTFSSLGWRRFVLISMEELDGAGFNSRYQQGDYSEKNTTGDRGGGSTYWSQNIRLARGLIREVYGDPAASTSPIRRPD
jgi:hypothetical protein